MSAKNTKYDFLIIGSGPEALVAALRLQDKGQNGVILEPSDAVGGIYRPLKINDRLFESHLDFLPFDDITLEAVRGLKHFVPELDVYELDKGPITFNNGHVQPFLGFGESHVQGLDQYAYFLASRPARLSLGAGALVEKLRELFKGEVLLQSEVTGLGLEPEPFVMVNGAQKISAKEIHFFDHPQKLARLLTASQAPVAKTLPQKLAKTPLWTAVSLVFHHKAELTQSPAIHVLYGAKEQPAVGRFQTENDISTSHWLTLVSNEIASDHESLGIALREMKKQIKRMYHGFPESISREVVLIATDAYGTVPEGLLHSGPLPKCPAIHVGSRYYSGFPGLQGDLMSLKEPAEKSWATELPPSI